MKTTSINAAWQGNAKCNDCAIRSDALFAHLDQKDFQNIHLPIEEQSYARGEVLYHAESDSASVMTLRSGLVKLIQHNEQGGQRIVRVLRPGDLVGIERLTGSRIRHDAVALSEVEVCRIPLAVIQALQSSTPKLYETLMQQWERVMTDSATWLADLSTGPARRRVAQLLLFLHAHRETDHLFLPSREEMGAMLGITTESTSKVTAQFRRQGWLRPVDQHRADIDVAALNDLISG